MKRPEKKIDKRKSRKVISKKRNKSEKHGTHKATTRRKEEKTRNLPEIKAGFQKDRHKFMKNEYFWQQKIRCRDEEKLVKKKRRSGTKERTEKNELKQKEKTQKRRWRKKNKETQEREKKRKRTMEIDK